METSIALQVHVSDAAAEIKEADYVVNSLNAIKRDFSVQGENAEYQRVLKSLQLRYHFWLQKWKYMLLVCSKCLDYALMKKDMEYVKELYTQTIPEKNQKLLDDRKGFRFRKLFRNEIVNLINQGRYIYFEFSATKSKTIYIHLKRCEKTM
jgi:hypothetical protein